MGKGPFFNTAFWIEFLKWKFLKWSIKKFVHLGSKINDGISPHCMSMSPQGWLRTEVGKHLKDQMVGNFRCCMLFGKFITV